MWTRFATELQYIHKKCSKIVTGDFSLDTFIKKRNYAQNTYAFCRHCSNKTKLTYIPSTNIPGDKLKTAQYFNTKLATLTQKNSEWDIPFLHASLRKDSIYRSTFYDKAKDFVNSKESDSYNIKQARYKHTALYLFYIILKKTSWLDSKTINSVKNIYYQALSGTKSYTKTIYILLVKFFSKVYEKFPDQSLPHPIHAAQKLGVNLNKHFVHIKYEIMRSYFENNPGRIDEFIPKNTYPLSKSCKFVYKYINSTDGNNYDTNTFDTNLIKFSYKCFNIYDIIQFNKHYENLLPVNILTGVCIFHSRKYHKREYISNKYNILRIDLDCLIVKWQFSISNEVKQIYKNRLIGSSHEKSFLWSMIFHIYDSCDNQNNMQDIIDFANNPNRNCSITNMLIAMFLNNIHNYEVTNTEGYYHISQALYSLVSSAKKYNLDKVLNYIQKFDNCRRYQNRYYIPNLDKYSKSNIDSIFLLCSADTSDNDHVIENMNKDIVETLIAFSDKNVDYYLINIFYDLGYCVPLLGRFGLDYGHEVIKIIENSSRSPMWEYLKMLPLSNIEKILCVSCDKYTTTWFTTFISLYSGKELEIHGFIIRMLRKSNFKSILNRNIVCVNIDNFDNFINVDKKYKILFK